MPDFNLMVGEKPLKSFVFGGMRSGKSGFAEKMVLRSKLKPVYIATGRATDEQMSERIAIHKERRGKVWTNIEEPLALADALRQSAFEGHAILVDCISVWIANLMQAGADIEREMARLVQTLGEVKIPIVLVSIEVGQGIVPDNSLAREFIDRLGQANQQLAKCADQAILIAAGLPIRLKG